MSGGVGRVGAGGTGILTDSTSGTIAPPQGAASTPITRAATPLASERFKDDATFQAIARGEKTLDLGAKGAAVKRLQLALVEIGHEVGTAGADASFGRGTQNGLSAFQRAAGLTASGKLDAATLAALDAKVAKVDHPAVTPLTAGLDAKRFAADPAYAPIAAGTATLKAGAKGAAVEKLQWTLIGLGYDMPRFGADKSFGGETTTALKAFQKDKGLPQTGTLDKATLLSLDDAVKTKIDALQALSPAPEEKAMRFRVVADLVKCRAYVLETGSDKPVASYLISPGTAEFPTRGTKFTMQGTKVLAPWTPPSSAWAAGLSQVPAGLENPMGIAKISFGAYAEYFHGIPKSAEKDLGKPASHGCVRLSGGNILEFHEKYVGAGSDVKLNRDAAESARLAAAFEAAGVKDRPIQAGHEYTAAYLYGEMGFNEVLGKDGRVTVGGRG